MFDLRMIKTESSALIEARKSDFSYRRVHMIKVTDWLNSALLS